MKTRKRGAGVGGRKRAKATIKSLARRAALARLKGNVVTAQRLEQLNDIAVRKAEREGWGDEAFGAEMRGTERGASRYSRKR